MRRGEQREETAGRGAWSSNSKNAALFSLLVSSPRRVVDFRDEITLLRVTPRRGNGRFTLHSCTQARQATLWVTIGFAGASPSDSLSLFRLLSLAAENDDDDDKFAPQHVEETRSGSRRESFNKSRTLYPRGHVRFPGTWKILWSRASCATERRLESRRRIRDFLSFSLFPTPNVAALLTGVLSR